MAVERGGRAALEHMRYEEEYTGVTIEHKAEVSRGQARERGM